MASVARETPAAAPTPPVARETGTGVAPERPTASPLRRLSTAIVLAPIQLYRRLISPLLGPRCRYYPTCSAYAEQAVRELGPVRGTILAVWRVLRCNPFSSGGLDPLESRRLFRSHDRDAHDRDAHEATTP